MRKFTTIFGVLLAGVVLTCPIFGQQSSVPADSAKTTEIPTHYFHLDLLVQELGADSKPVNSRSYSITVGTAREDRNVSMRTGSRIPVPTGAATSTGAPTQFQYMDVGVNFDVSDVREIGSKLAINLTTDISSLASEIRPNTLNAPVVRNNRWHSPVLLSLNKPTVVFTSDSLDSKGSMQVLVTATPLQ